MEVEFYDLTADVQQKVKECEGIHVQQVAYSSYHESLTQVCFGCNKVRTSLKKEDLKEIDAVEKNHAHHTNCPLKNDEVQKDGE